MSVLGERLDGQVAYITGASAGIGAAIARRLAEHGAAVVLGARRQDQLDEVADALRRDVPGARVTALPLDVNDDDSVDAFLRLAEERAGPPTVLVNNAGLARGTEKVEDAEPRDWDVMLDTNVRAVVHITRKVVPGLLARGGGDVVMIASVAGSDPYPGGSVYCATKAAVQAFAGALRQETLGRNVRVLTFDPGLVETEFSVVRFKGDAERAKKPYEGIEPLTADDVADCVAFALTRPRHVSLDRMLILATAQAGTKMVARQGQ